MMQGGIRRSGPAIPVHSSARDDPFKVELYMKNSLAHLFTWYGTRRRTSLPRRTPASLGLEYQDISFPSAHEDKVRLSGWTIPSPHPKAVVILCHGIDNTSAGMLPKAAMLHRNGYATLLFDFRANGRSEGKHGTLGFREMDDVVGAVDFIKSRPSMKDLPILALGESMGGAAVIRAAAHCKTIRAVISESAFATLDNALRHRLKILGPYAREVATECYRIGVEQFGVKLEEVTPEREIAALSPRPLLLIPDNLDILCNRKESDRLYAAAGEPKERWDVPHAPHTFAFMIAPKQYERRVCQFLSRSLTENESTPTAASSK
jgi:fermentation-respiration switch protein FrsA (DUF1100 family)